MATRPISTIAMEIYSKWPKVNYAAAPYLEAMMSMDDVSDNVGFDSGRSIVRYFLANASSWRGDDAKRIKAELKSMVA